LNVPGTGFHRTTQIELSRTIADYSQFHRPRLRGLIEVGIAICFAQDVHQRLRSPYGFSLLLLVAALWTVLVAAGLPQSNSRLGIAWFPLFGVGLRHVGE
jgi:hypothetical protein